MTDTSINTKFPSSSFVRVGERWFRVAGHCPDGVTVNTYSVDTGKSMAIHFTCIDEVSDMARPRKTAEQKKADAAAKVTDTLLAAVEFCKPGYREGGETYSTHASINFGWLSTYSGIVQYGIQVDTPMTAFPNYSLFLSALRAAKGDTVQLSQISPERLAIKGKGFRTVVPCLADQTLVPRHAPDNPVGGLDSRIREGFEMMRQVARKTGETVMSSAVKMFPNYMVACDNRMVAMFWHGHNFPELVVPADFIEAVLRVPKAIMSFGFTPDQSLTFWFEDNSFIRTQLYAEGYPDVNSVIPSDWSGLQPIPEAFFPAIEKIEPFIGKGVKCVWVRKGELHTMSDAEDTVIECAGLAEHEWGIDPIRIGKLAGYVTHMDLNGSIARFVGETARAIVTNAEPIHDTPAFAPPAPVSDGNDGAPVDEPEAVGGFAPPPGFA